MSGNETADLVLIGGPILTMSDWSPGSDTAAVIAAAPRGIASRDGIVVAVGEHAACALVGPDTEVVQLAGRTVIPGVGDAHLHFNAYSMATNGYTPLGPTILTRWEDLAEHLTPDAVGRDSWIRGHGWSEIRIGRLGTRHDLDSALAVHDLESTPTVLFDWSGHSLLANTAALQLAGITSATAAPPGGVIGIDAHGELTGILGDGAMALLNAVMPPVPVETKRQAYLSAQHQLHALGITAITEPGLGPGASALLDGSGGIDSIELLADLARSSELTLRVSVLMLFVGTGGANVGAVQTGIDSRLGTTFSARGIDARQLRIAGVKVFADGVPMNHTCWFHEPYGEQNDRGSMVVVGATDQERVEELNGIIRAIHDAGLQAGVHAIGDAAVDAVVEAIRLAQSGDEGPHRRHYLIHGSVISEHSLGVMVEQEIGLATNPVITVLGRDGRDPTNENLRRVEPMRTMQALGVRASLMTDSPIVSPDWRHNVIHAVRRSQLYRTQPSFDRENVSGIDALATVTILPAVQEHAESYRGDLAPGKMADLVVLSGLWPADEDIEALADLHADKTIVGGRTVYDRRSAGAAQ